MRELAIYRELASRIQARLNCMKKDVQDENTTGRFGKYQDIREYLFDIFDDSLRETVKEYYCQNCEAEINCNSPDAKIGYSLIYRTIRQLSGI